MPTPTIAQLQQAISIAEKIEKLQTELAGLIGGSSSVASLTTSVPQSKGRRGGKRTMSAATIAKMRASQQARWAKAKGPAAASSAAPVATSRKKKRKLSPEGRARIVAALKARHAAKRNAAK